MSLIMYIVFFIIALFRVCVLFISKKNEQKLIFSGGVEYGKLVSKILAMLHTLFYFMAFFEGYQKEVQFDSLSKLGLFSIIISFCMLVVVIRILNQYWTVKLIFSSNHILNTHWLFKYTKHPNYFFNIIPELIGVTLLFHAWMTIAIMMLPYSICLYLRIKEENRLLINLE
ncbi:DUF1295 domain-containing protein [Enterococcus casseliflavus]|nr:DUF1295 domain-containing protein [Enterococcus casseliflavus]MBF0014393.1 DUF1295 domain-containing protein [Enterococcus casseliflavus]